MRDSDRTTAEAIITGTTIEARAILQAEPGGPALMKPGTVAVPPPAAGEVRLRVLACGLNPVDWKIAQSGLPDWQWPHVPGLDVVEKVVIDVAESAA